MDSGTSQNGEQSEIEDDNQRTTSIDTALTKRAISVREKLQDDTYSWIMQCLEMVFEFYNEKNSRDQEIKKLTDVTLKFCTQQLEHKKAKDTFEALCLTHPVKSCPRDFDFTKEYDKMLTQQEKVTKEEARKHPKFVKFLDRVKELERGKELCQTEAISVD
ncbi:uncharacterized protein [Hetaerina americana]|uniref:uncharacterized protein n=1 Tax=Hetaerina americana TaxID=62018 RepID=UPI003A7F2CE5